MRNIESVSERLEQFVALSNDGTPLGRKALIWLLRQSQNLTRDVALSASLSAEKVGKEIATTAHDMISILGGTHINLILKIANSPVFVSAHCGRYYGGEFCPEGGGYTVWISSECYGRNCQVIVFELADEKSAEEAEVLVKDIEALDLNSIGQLG